MSKYKGHHYESFYKIPDETRLEKAVKLFLRCQEATDRVESSMAYFEFLDYFRRSFIDKEQNNEL